MAFWDKASKTDKKSKKLDKKDDVISVEKKKIETTLPLIGNAGAYRVLKNFYVSEKASMLAGFNQYVFRVFNETNKVEVKKQVEKMFNVKVKDVNIVKMPRKRRDLGRHPGFKSGFKKAIVRLEEGYTIEQAKT